MSTKAKTKPKKKAVSAKVKTKAKKAKPRKNSLPLVNFKANGKDRAALHANAKRFTKGNLSEWLRFAGIAFRPNKTQLSSISA